MMERTLRILQCVGLTSVVVITIAAIMLENPMAEGIFLMMIIASGVLLAVGTLIKLSGRKLFALTGVFLSISVASFAAVYHGKAMAMCALGVLLVTTLILDLWLGSVLKNQN